MESNLQKYMAFVKTVEMGSFTKAAQELNYAQSSVSKMIQDLEKEWKVTLLERNRGGVHLTASGEQVLPYVRMLIEDYQKLESHIDRLGGIQTGLLRIGIFSSVSINYLPGILAEFQKDFPGIEYEMLLGDYGEVEKWIEEGRVDCGFLSLPAKPEFDTFFVIRDEYKLVLPKGHPLSGLGKVPVQALENQPFMLLEHGGRTEATEILERHQVHPQIRFTTWEDFAIMAMAEKGLGIGILPGLILEKIPYDLEIRSLDPPYFREIGLAVKNKKRLSPVTEKFIEYLR